MPTVAMKSAKPRVDAIEPNAAGYAVQTTVITKISQTAEAQQDEAIER
jgi:hypothetical protein